MFLLKTIEVTTCIGGTIVIDHSFKFIGSTELMGEIALNVG